MHKLSVILFTLALAAASPVALVAQNQPSSTNAGPSDTTTLPTVTVRAEAEASLVTPVPETARQTLNQVAGGTNFLLAEDYKQGRAANLQDVLGFQPGVLAVSRFGAEEARISIRGSGIQRTFHGRGIRILFDGLTFNEADGGFDMQVFEPLALQHLEVYRGANGMIFGASSLGGAINMVSPTGYTASLAQARFETGSFGTYRAQISSGAVHGPVDYYVSGTHSARDGFRDYSQQSNQRVHANLGWRHSEDSETRFYYHFALSDSELPGSLTKAQFEQNPAAASAGNVARIDKRDFSYHRLAVKNTTRFDQARLETGFYWSNKDLDHPIFNTTGPFFTGPGTIDFVSNNFGADIRWTDEAERLGRRNKLVIGLSPNGSITEDNRFLNRVGTTERGRKFGDGTEEVFNFEGFIQNEHEIVDKTWLVLGLACTYAERNFKDDFITGANPDDSRDQDYAGVSPKIGMRYDFTPETNVFWNLSRSFEPPTFGEIKTVRGGVGPNFPQIGTQELEAQSATTIEIGTRGRQGRLAWDFAFYHAWVDNELLQYEIAPNTSNTINATGTHHQGIELGLDVTLLEGLLSEKTEDRAGDRVVLRQVYNWSNFFFDSDPQFGSNQLAGVPEHFYRAELVYRHPCGFYAGPNVEWVITKYPVDFTNTLHADPYALLGFRAGYQSARGFSCFIEGKNLTDKEYIATTGVIDRARPANLAQFSPGDGLGIYGGVEWKY